MCLITNEAQHTAEAILDQRRQLTRARSPLRQQIAMELAANEHRLADLLEILNDTQSMASALFNDLIGRRLRSACLTRRVEHVSQRPMAVTPHSLSFGDLP